MAIGIGQVVAIGLRIVSNRDKIASLWDQILPLAQEIRGRDPGRFADVIDAIMPGGRAPSPESFTVEWLQESLNKLGANPQLVVDGSYGDATKEAVRTYQSKNGLAVDGWAGVDTQAAIYKDLHSASA